MSIHTATDEVTLSRTLSLFDITMIGVGAMIGAGVFVLTGIAAGAAGPALILSFALNGIITIFTAMVYAELGSAIPEAGGGYLWVREGLPGPNAFQAGWMSWFAHAVAGSLYALGFGAFLALLFERLGVSLGFLEGELLHKGLAILIILLFLVINFRGVSETGTAGNIVTVLKVIILLIFVGSGIWAIYNNPDYLNKFQNFAPNGFVGILSAMGLTFIAFEGYEIIVQAGEEVQNPRQTIPKAVFLSLAIVVPIYILVAFVAIGAVNPDTNIPTYQWLAEHAELGIAEAARQFMPFGTFLLLIGGLLSTMSALNATTFSSTRVSFAMGRDKNLPDAFADINKWTRTPHKALMLTGALIIFMAVSIPIEDVAAAADIMFMLLFLQVNVAVITIRKKYGDRLHYGYLMPFFPIVPIIGIVTKLFLAIFLFNFSPIAWYFAIAWLAIGFAVYYFYAQPRTKRRSRTPVVLEEKRTVEVVEDRYRVLVPIANPASLPVLLTPAIRTARENDGIITLLHVITVPDQLPLSAGREYIESSKELTREAVAYVEREDVPVEVLTRISHRPAEAIVQTAYERAVDLLVMGWRGQSQSGTTAIGRNVDDIIEEVNCEVLIVQQSGVPPFRRILVPIADPLQTKSAVEMTHLLVANDPALVTVVHVFAPETSPEERQQFMDALQLQIEALQREYPELKEVIKLEEVVAPDIVSALVNMAENYDSVVLGTTRDSWLKQQFFGSKPSRIAQQVEPPVILVRPKTGAIGFGLRRVLNYIRGGYRVIDPASEKELREQGILLPQAERDTEALHTSVNRLAVVLAGVLAVVSVALIYWGAGGTWTWIGVVAFFVAMFWFTWQSMRGTERFT